MFSGGWRVTDQPQCGLERWAHAQHALFASAEWANVLQGLGCRTLFAWHAELRAGWVVPVFRRGPFRIGFLGFPVAGEVCDRLGTAEFVGLQRALARVTACDLIRGVRSSAANELPEGMAGTALPEATIEDLRAWPPPDVAKRMRKDLAYAARATRECRVVADLGDAASAYALYRQTVLGYGGRLRYTPEYFQRLQQLCRTQALARAVSLVDARDRLLGFAVMARGFDTGYYLHAAVAREARSMGTADVLLAELIRAAQAAGCQRFRLMASPRNQPGLVQYKKKWGGREGHAVTHDLGVGIAGKALQWLLHR